MGKTKLSRRGGLFVAAIAGLLLGGHAVAARRIVVAGANGQVNLPYPVADNSGTQWYFYQGGWFQQQGNRPTFGQAANLTVNNNGPQVNNNVARLDAETGEIIFENMNVAGIGLTRRVLVDKDDQSVRYVDIFNNPQAQDQVVDVRLQSNVNYGVASAELVDDPKRKGQKIAWVAQTQGGGCAAEMFAGKGSKVPADISWQQGNNQVQVTYHLTIPAHGDVAIMHLHNIATSQEKGVDWANSLRESKLLAELPRNVRSLIVNFPGGQSYIGGRELLRGDSTSDIVELRGGDQLKGTLKPQSYSLDTFYGKVELPADRVVSILNVGEFRPRQLFVTTEGEIFGGYLDKDTLELQLSTGQTTQIPFAQIARAGYRKRPNEPEEWTFKQPMVVLRSGDRMIIQPPAGPLEVMTRYGLLKLPTASIAAVLFQSDELNQGVHEIRLTDGSRVAGLLTSEKFDLELATKSQQQVQSVSVQTGGMLRLQIAPGDGDSNIDPADNASTLNLAGGDILVGAIQGTLKLDTAFDTLALNAAEIRKITRSGDEASAGSKKHVATDDTFGADLQVTLWDNSVVRGQLRATTVEYKLDSGPTVHVPVSLINVYTQPSQKASAEMTERVKGIVTRLNADDWRERDRAQQELSELGETITSILRDLRPSQPPEAQQRIDQILNKVEGDTSKPPAVPPAANPQPGGAVEF